MKPTPTTVMAVAVVCTCAATPKPPAGPVPPPATTATAPPPEQNCGAGHLPRITEQSFGAKELDTFLDVASKGTVAIDWNGTRARVVTDCHLDGRYTGVKGGGGWRFRATNRVLFRTDEVAGECRNATHVIAAYVTRSSSPRQMSGILVPLPCPPVADSKPAPGCIARGVTGPARVDQAEKILEKIERRDTRKTDIATALRVFALVPDDDRGITAANNIDGDCPFLGQGQWLASQYSIASDWRRPDDPAVVRLLDASKRAAPPKYSWQGCGGDYCDCRGRPVFLQCFPGQFEPLLSGPGRWEPADPKEQP